MSFTFLTGDNSGALYAVNADGTLLFYRDEARDGTPLWANFGIAKEIGSGWIGFSHVFAAGDGVIYAVATNGTLFYFRDLAHDGTPDWAHGGAGQAIGSGFDGFTHVISGGDGVIYAVTEDGDLLYFRDLARDGSEDWAFGGAAQLIGTGFSGFKQLLGGDGGVIYAITEDGTMLYYRDLARDGSEDWAFGGAGQAIGSGWGNFAAVVAGGDGIFYAITPDGFMLYYRDLARDGTEQWAFDARPVTLGSGWLPGAETQTTVEGYCVPLSAAPGEVISFLCSSPRPFEVTYLRLVRGADGSVGEPMAAPIARPPGLQLTLGDAWKHGAGWKTTFSLSVPSDWPSGLYAARCSAEEGDDFYIVFVVKPVAAVRGDIALLANTNTWNAYNEWGGRSKYTQPVGATLSFDRPNRLTTPVDHGQIDHLARAEGWILDWLLEAGYAVDVYSDEDFHSGIEEMNDYKAVVLSTHPEYWSALMLDNLEAFLTFGGNVLYLGGNGVFECVELDIAARKMVLMGGDDSISRDPFYFRNLEPPRAERSVLGVAYRYDNYMTFGPYEVKAPGHRFFAGTGLGTGDLIGASGINGGGASGWEMDTSQAGPAGAGIVVSANGADDRGDPPPDLVLLARGTNPGFGADMTVYETAAGGIVFSAGSISFGGSLIVDADLQQIVRNVLDECLAAP